MNNSGRFTCETQSFNLPEGLALCYTTINPILLRNFTLKHLNDFLILFPKVRIDRS